MKELITQRVESLIQNYKEISCAYKWESSMTNNFSALIYTLNEKTFQKESVEEIKKYIKSKTGIFSNFRGVQGIILGNLLITQYDNPKREFDKILSYFEKMKTVGFKNSIYSPIACYALLATCDEEFADSRINKAWEIYRLMKENHPWVTGGDDYPLAFLLANSGRMPKVLTDDIEEIYSELNSRGFSKGNSLQFLSHILSFSSEDRKLLADRCRNIFEKLKGKKLRVYSNSYSALGLITLLGGDIDEVLSDIEEIVKCFEKEKKLKWLGKEMHILIASAVVCDVYIENNKEHSDLVKTALGVSIETLIAAQTAAVIAALSASSAGAASGSS